MKTILRSLILSLLMIFSGGILSTYAQPYGSPGEYMESMTKEHTNITEQFVSYTSAVSHGKSARKVEKRRKELIKTVQEAISKTKALSGYQGDSTIRNASLDYLTICYNVLNQDYGKIVDLEAIAEDSYDNMEAYLTAQEKAGEKMKEAADKMITAQRLFAGKHTITLLEDETSLSKKVEKIGKVEDYYHVIYLVFFKSYKQNAYLMKAMEEKNINGMEQDKNTLIKNAEEGLSKLEGIQSFEGDLSLVANCKKLLQFYQKEAREMMPVISDFYMKGEQFDAKKKAMEGSTQHSKEEVEEYNKAVKEFNLAVNNYNKTINELNLNNTNFTNGWNEAVKNFMDKHMPYK